MTRRRFALVAAVLAGAFVIALPAAVAAPGGPGTRGPASQTLVTVHPFDWKTTFGATDPSILPGLDVSLFSVATAGEAGAGAAPDLPTVLNGRPTRLVGVQLCYDATHGGTQTDVTMTQFLVRVDSNTTGTTKTNPVAAAVDTTPRSDEACRTYPVDWLLRPGDMAAAGITVDFDTSGTFFEIGRLTFVLETAPPASGD